MILGVVIGVIAAVVGGLSYKAARDAQRAAKKAAEAMAGVLVNKESNIQAIPVIYGVRRVGGTRVFVHAEGGNKNEFLYICLVLCEGEVQQISNIEIDNRAVTDSRYSGLISYQTFTGSDTQTASSLLSATSKWGSNHRLNGIAYIAIRLKWDQDVFSGIPDITALVQGKKVYDPRTATTVFTNNAALCIRDYLTNTRYGKGLATSEIDDTSFEDAADDIEAFTVTEYSGGPSGVQLFTLNAVIDTDDPIFQNLEKMLLGCKGFLPYQDGKYSLYIDQSQTAVMTLDQSTILDGISIQSEKKEDKFNRVICKFPNPDTDYQPDQAIWPDPGSSEETTFLAEDDGEVLIDEIDLETITSAYAARDFARIFCLRSRNALRVALTATSEALNLRVGDVVNITHSTPAWTAKPFQIESVALKYDGTVDLQCVEYDSTIYAYDEAAAEATYDDTDLPDPFDVDAPSALSISPGAQILGDGSVNSFVNISWTASDDSFVSYYEVLVVGNEASFSNQTFYEEVTGTSVRVNGLSSGLSYSVKVKAVNTLGVKSGELSGTFTAVGDTTAPGNPTNLTAQGGIQIVDLFWDNPSDNDLDVIEVRRSNDTTFGNAVDIGQTKGSTYADPRPAGVGTYYYWIRAKDTSGNTGSWVGYVAGTTIQLAVNDFANGIIDFSHFNTTFQSDFTTLEGDVAANISDITSLFARITTAEGDIIGNATAISGVQTSVAQNGSDISALSQSLTSLTTTVGTNTASISSNLASINGVEAQYSVVIDNNGHVTGYGLISSGIGQGGTPTSAFVVNADQFAIGGTGSQVDHYPFVVYTTATTVTMPDGTSRTLPAGTYIESANVGEIIANSITSGSINLANNTDMNIRQGKTSPSIQGTGFWLGNNAGTAQFWLGNNQDYMYWDGTSLVAKELVATRLEIKDGSNNTILSAGGDFDGAYISNATVDTLQIAGNAVMVPFSGQLTTGTTLVPGTPAYSPVIGPVTWTSSTKPPRLLVIATANFITNGTGSGQTRTIAIRCLRANNQFMTNAVVDTQGSAQVPENLSASVTASVSVDTSLPLPNGIGSGQYFQLEMQCIGGTTNYKEVGSNQISIFAVKR
jgi:hypothetical protein